MASSAPLIIKFSAFTFSKTCSDGTLTYTATLSNLKALPGCILFTASTIAFSISTSSDTDRGTYNIILTGTTVNGYSAISTFELIISNRCEQTVITPYPLIISPIYYDISKGSATTIVSLSWTQSMSSLCPTIIYSLFT